MENTKKKENQYRFLTTSSSFRHLFLRHFLLTFSTVDQRLGRIDQHVQGLGRIDLDLQ